VLETSPIFPYVISSAFRTILKLTKDLESEALTATVMNVAVFRNISSCSFLLYPMFLATLIFHHEHGSDSFLRNVGSHMDYTTLYLRKWQVSLKVEHFPKQHLPADVCIGVSAYFCEKELTLSYYEYELGFIMINFIHFWSLRCVQPTEMINNTKVMTCTCIILSLGHKLILGDSKLGLYGLIMQFR
jgi:hypothetical protein